MNRVVTGFDAQGNPTVIAAGEPPTVIHAGRYTTTELWVSGRSPIAPGDTDTSTQGWALEPPPGGACFRIVEIGPADDEDIAVSDDEPGQAGHAEFQGTHATSTLDYVTILRGEVTLIVGGGEIVLRPLVTPSFSSQASRTTGRTGPVRVPSWSASCSVPSRAAALVRRVS